MLIQFLVENFLSFKDETVFSMVAPPEETRAVVEIPALGLRLLRISAFYGANASGKSNLIEAMETFRDLIATEQPSDAKLPARFFRLDPAASSKPSRCQFDFVVTDIRYTYILVITRDSVVAEALYRKLPDAMEEIVYEREAPIDKGEHVVTLGPMFNAGNEEERQFARFTARGAHIRQPLLTKFANGNVPGFDSIHGWFKQGLSVLNASSRYGNLVTELHKNAELRRFFSRMLEKMGTGVHEIRIKREKDSRFTEFSKEFSEVVQVPNAKKIIYSILRNVDSADGGIELDEDGNETNILKLELAHINRAGFEVLFPLHYESDGTKRLLDLLPVLFHRTREAGQCTIIDELDRSLHTTLTRHFVQEFLNMASDTQTQLIFTTHDTNLLNGRLLPARAIWFVEKDDDGASRIYSLSEYKPEQLEQLLEHLEDGYLQGRFGAIPFIADRKNLGWESHEETHKA